MHTHENVKIARCGGSTINPDSQEAETGREISMREVASWISRANSILAKAAQYHLVFKTKIIITFNILRKINK